MTYLEFKYFAIEYLDKHTKINLTQDSEFIKHCANADEFDTYKIRVKLNGLVRSKIIEKHKLATKSGPYVTYVLSNEFIKNRPVFVKKYTLYTVLKVNGSEQVVSNDDPILKIAILQNRDSCKI